MIPSRALPWLWAILIAIALSAAQMLDGPSDDEAAADQAADLQNAIENEASNARYSRASRQLCFADGATASDLGDGAMQCHAKRGHNTAKVSL